MHISGTRSSWDNLPILSLLFCTGTNWQHLAFMDPSRRFFLRGGVTSSAAAVAAPPRPPWALEEAAFVTACTRCDACIDACPQHILSKGDGGFPIVKFDSNGCNECKRCEAICSKNAIVSRPGQQPWTWRAVVGPSCLAAQRVECRVCGEMCDAGAIRFRPSLSGVSQPEVSASECTGCGQCVGPCPTQAIQMVTPPA